MADSPGRRKALTLLFLQKMGSRIADYLPIDQGLWHKIDLLKALVQRDLEGKYRGSFLGNFWTILNQLAQLLIFTYVFSIILKVRLTTKGIHTNDNLSFGLWLFAGLLSWTAFSGGFLQAATSVVNQPNLVKKVVFPLGLLPLVPILTAFVESTFGLLTLLGFMLLLTGKIPLTIALLPLVWIPQLLITAGFGYLAAGLTVFIRDIPQTLGVLINLWFYVTPIVYPTEVIPEAWRNWVFWLNPLATISTFYREAILDGKITHWRELGFTTCIAVAIFAFGLWVYRRARPAFADVL